MQPTTTTTTTTNDRPTTDTGEPIPANTVYRVQTGGAESGIVLSGQSEVVIVSGGAGLGIMLAPKQARDLAAALLIQATAHEKAAGLPPDPKAPLYVMPTAGTA